MPIVPNIMGMVAGINERKRSGRVRESMGNYLDDPEGAIRQIMVDDPDYARSLQQEQEATRVRGEDRRSSLFQNSLGQLRGLEGEEQERAIEGLAPLWRESGLGEQGIQNVRSALAANPELANNMDPEAWKGIAQARFGAHSTTPGMKVTHRGETIASSPLSRTTMQVGNEIDGYEVVIFDPNTGNFVTEDGAPASPAAARQAQEQLSLQDDFDSTFAPTAQPAPQRSAQSSRSTGAEIEAIATGAVPGINVTSRGRTAEHNARVGGVANSQHLESNGGSARDYTPPRGTSMSQLASQLRTAYGEGYKVINEGDHVHVEQRRGGAQAQQPAQAQQRQPQGSPVEVTPTRVRVRGRGRDQYRAATPAELRPYGPGAAAQVNTATGQLDNITRPPVVAQRGAAGGVEDRKAARRSQDQQAAKGRLTSMLAQMGGDYVRLSEMGDAIVDSRRGSGANIIASINSSGFGQTLGGIVGSEAQAVRQNINQMRPLLLNQIRQASEMGARGMDSNKEMQFYLQAATDPGRELLSNLAALQVLDTAYGMGGALTQSLTPDVLAAVSQHSRLLRQEMSDETGEPGTEFGSASSPSSRASGWGQARVVE